MFFEQFLLYSEQVFLQSIEVSTYSRNHEKESDKMGNNRLSITAGRFGTLHAPPAAASENNGSVGGDTSTLYGPENALTFAGAKA